MSSGLLLIKPLMYYVRMHFV